ncbi:MAG: site-specific DNA-methyltransferase [Elusimicrobiota bacterium]|jgi:DNA modification methylase|nr:site-specific DNA-methyltransferase [Elusimicrobiota bacterium]
MVNKLILGDNLEILRKLDSEIVDLIYLDPPFFSNRNYEVIWGDAGEVRSFQDRWAGGISHYIDWLKERVEQMHRVLKQTGSIYLHCDWHADAYIRVNVLDKLFGDKQFRNEIVWSYRTGGAGKKQFARKHDSIWFYTKSKNYTFNTQYYKSWQNKRYAYNANYPELWDEKEGKWYHEAICRDVWDEINPIGTESKERIGYPTQKPEALLERIIKASSNKGDIILDPFMGGGTTIAVAEKLGRQWIGIDQSVQAVKVTEFRLEKQYGATKKQAALFTAPYIVQLHKYDYDTLRYKDAFEFESWVVQQFGGTSNIKQRVDMGLDGKTADGTPIQVKRSDNVGRDVIDKFIAAIQRFDKALLEKNIAEKKPIGYIIAFSFGRGAVEEATRLKNTEDRIIKLVRVDEIVPIATKPEIAVRINELERGIDDLHKIELIAEGKSEAGIEFYSWDFSYDKEKGFKPSIFIDKDGKQTVSLKTGTHNIAVKVVDNDGLENIETIKLKINGVVEQSR